MPIYVELPAWEAGVQTVLLGIALLLAIGWLILRIRYGKTELAPKPAIKSPHKKVDYHAVSIRFEENACSAAKVMSSRRFLSNAAPQLPLPECDALECRCIFTHHGDRRGGKDRRSPFGTAVYGGDGTGSPERDRRARKGRRENADLNDV